MIIGLTGTMGSGKGEVVNILMSKGFEHHVFSDIIREEAKKRGLKPTRENLQKVGNTLRKEKEPGYMAKMLIKRFKKQDVVVDGIRSLDELDALKERQDFVLVGVDAPQRLRYERIKARERKGDPDSFEEFKMLDDRENNATGKGQEIRRCIAKADHLIINDSSIEELRKNVEDILSDI